MIAAQRETFFRCTFSSPRVRRVAHVRAWDPVEAVQLFQAELQGDGVAEAGAIEVAEVGGRARHRAGYSP